MADDEITFEEANQTPDELTFEEASQPVVSPAAAAAALPFAVSAPLSMTGKLMQGLNIGAEGVAPTEDFLQQEQQRQIQRATAVAGGGQVAPIGPPVSLTEGPFSLFAEEAPPPLPKGFVPAGVASPRTLGMSPEISPLAPGLQPPTPTVQPPGEIAPVNLFKPSGYDVAVQGIGQSLIGAADFMLSPAGIATMGIGSLPVAAQRVIALAFAGQMGKAAREIAGEIGTELGKNPEDRDRVRVAKLLTDLATTTGFATAAGTHAIAPRRPTVETRETTRIPPEEPSAPPQTRDYSFKEGVSRPGGPPITLDEFESTFQEGKANTNTAVRAGLGAKTIDDLATLLKAKEDARAQRKIVADPTKTPEQKDKAFKISQLSQLPREAIETAVNIGGHLEGFGTTLPNDYGPRPLDFRQNPEVARWLINNAERIWDREKAPEFIQEIEKSLRDATGDSPQTTPIGDEQISSAAFRDLQGQLHVGANHTEILDRLGLKGFDNPESRNTPQFGFMTDRGRFITREQAGPFSEKSGQDLKEFEPGEPVAASDIASPTEPDKPLSETEVEPLKTPLEGTITPQRPPSDPKLWEKQGWLEELSDGSWAAYSDKPGAHLFETREQAEKWLTKQSTLPATPQPISVGPGSASPGDVPPPPPPTQPVTAMAPEDRPNGHATPSSPGLWQIVSGLAGKVNTFLKGIAGDSMPKTTTANREVGEAGVRYASSPIFALRAARLFSTQTLQGTDINPMKFGAALVEDNLRSIREAFRAQVTRFISEGRSREAAEARAKADAVTSLIGVEGSPFRDEDEYQDFLENPNTKRAIEQHKQQWEEVVDPMFKRAQGIDPDVELPTRGQQTGARINLKAILPDETGASVVRTGPSLTATFKRKSPFARAAKGTGRAYEVDYHELMSNTFTRQMEIANKNAFDNALVKSGNAVIDRPGQKIEIKGEAGVPFPLTRRVLIGQGEPVPLAQNIYVRQSLAREYRTAANVDPQARIPVLTPVLGALNRAALAGLTDFTVHASNQLTALFNRPVSGRLLSDSLLSATGRADVPVTVVRGILKAFQNNERQLTELAEIGALREAPQGANPLGRVLGKTDQLTRLLLDDTFKRLADAGLVENTQTARREYVNQIGQYNKRLQGPLVRLLRDTGFGPFVTAGRTFNALGVKMATMSPGAKAANIFAAAGLRANVLSKWVGFSVLLGTLNYLLTKDKGGGVLGRKGVPIGNLDTGLSDKRGRPLSLPLADIMGLARGARVTGVKGALQAKHLGLTDSDALDASARDIINSATGPALGPGIRGAVVAATGSPPAVGVPRTAPVAPPGTSQFKVNVEEALKDANPLVKSFFDYTKGGKTLGEALGQQVPRFGLVPGKPETVAANYPKIVNRAQLNNYVDALAREARQQPLGERKLWVADRLAKDRLTAENSKTANQLLQRKGVFKYE